MSEGYSMELDRNTYYGLGMDLWDSARHDKAVLDNLLDYLEVYREFKVSIVQKAVHGDQIEIPEFGDPKKRFKMRVPTLINFLKLSTAVVRYGSQEVYQNPKEMIEGLTKGMLGYPTINSLQEYEKIAYLHETISSFRNAFRHAFPESSDFHRLSDNQVSFLTDVTTNLLNFGLTNVRHHTSARISKTKGRI